MMRLVSGTLGLLLALWIPYPVFADGDGGGFTPKVSAPTVSSDVRVASGPSGVTIYIGITTTTPGSSGTPGSTELISSPGAPECTATPMNIGHGSAGWVQDGLAANPDTVPWTVSCDTGYFGVAWVPVDAPGTPGVVVSSPPGDPVDPLTVAESILGLVPVPPVTVSANPGIGMVAMPSWFWVDGYDGAPLYGAETLGLITVEVEATPDRYDWSFGDGHVLATTSLGQRFPAESDIQHTYEQSAAAVGGAFPVRLEITFSARYRVNGGAWLPLSPIAHAFTQDYPVQQLQAVLTRGQ